MTENIRIVKQRAQQTVVPNQILTDPSISLSARFLWVWLLSFVEAESHPFPDDVEKNLGITTEERERIENELISTGWLRIYDRDGVRKLTLVIREQSEVSR